MLWCPAIRHAILAGEPDARIGLQYIDPERRNSGLCGSMSLKIQPSDSTVTGGWSRHCRARGRPSPPRPYRRPSCHRVCSGSITSAWRSTPRCAAARTPTQSPQSRAACSALSTGPQRSPRSGVARCTAGLDCAPATSSSSRPRSPERAGPTSSTSATAATNWALWQGIPMTMVSGWATSVLCGRCLTVSIRSCRCAGSATPTSARAEQIDVRLIDQPEVNDNLDFVLLDTVRLVEQLRQEGRTVLIHCVQAQSRTPAIAALYGARCAESKWPRHWLTCVASCRTPIRSEFCEALRRVHPVARRNEDMTDRHPGEGGVTAATGDTHRSSPTQAVRSQETMPSDVHCRHLHRRSCSLPASCRHGFASR